MTLLPGVSGCGENGNAADHAAGTTGSAAPDLEVAPPTREEVLLVQRMRNASVDEIKAYMRECLDEGLPEDYVIPQYVYDAGDPKTCSTWIGERYPEFYGLQGMNLVQAAGKHPVRYRELIRVSRAMRKVYADHMKPPADGAATSNEQNPENQTRTP